MSETIDKIQLKRTNSSIDDTTIQNAELNPAECLFVKDGDYLVVGDGAEGVKTKVKDLKVFKAVDRAVADGQGVKWLDHFHFIPENYIKYAIDSTTGKITSETTTTVPCAIKITSTQGGTGNNLANIYDGIKPQLSYYILPADRSNVEATKRAKKNFAFIVAGEVYDGYIVLYFNQYYPQTGFYMDLIGG